MYTNVSEHDFINISNMYKQYKDNFSYYGKKALYRYLVDLEEDTGQEMEMDWIAICSDFSEYDSEEELLKEYQEKSIDDIMDKTEVIKFKYYIDMIGDVYQYRYIIRNY